MMFPFPVSVLDLVPVPEGHDASYALAQARRLAALADSLGYARYWVAEHHNMPGIASAATAVVLAHVAAGTTRIRIGSGGVMLPNHAPFVIAEQFGTLAALYPGRIDLGVGRAPGTDPLTTRALRRNLAITVEGFPQALQELMGYFAPPRPGQAIEAFPASGQLVEFWVLGSSLYGAQLAAALGLPYAFASHFAPAARLEAAALYRLQFTPSVYGERPHLMIGANAIVASSDREAEYLATSLQQAFVRLRRGQRGPLPRPVAGYGASLTAEERDLLGDALACTYVGTAERVRSELAALVEQTRADELIVSAAIHDTDARLASFELLADG